MKKKTKELPAVSGWTAIDRIRGYCTDCGILISFEDVAYHRKIEGRTQINCPECIKEKQK